MTWNDMDSAPINRSILAYGRAPWSNAPDKDFHIVNAQYNEVVEMWFTNNGHGGVFWPIKWQELPERPV